MLRKGRQILLSSLPMAEADPDSEVRLERSMGEAAGF
jgi:hypothetical protein